MTYRPKEFIETAEGLRFAVVADGTEDGRVLCFLRYVRQEEVWRKVDTQQANLWLAHHGSDYLYYSVARQAALHAVPIDRITVHFQPQICLQRLIAAPATDAVTQDLLALTELMRRDGLDLSQWGVTGSLLTGVQNAESDIDLVCYQRSSFQHARQLLSVWIEQATVCTALDILDWQESYRRRGCSISLDDYIRHETRKFNKALIRGRKFDLSLLADDHPLKHHGATRKVGPRQIEALVTDDTFAYDYPALFSVEHPDVDCVVSYTATYTGQAQRGERLQAAGFIEQDSRGFRQLVVGSSREADGEFIRVISPHSNNIPT